MAADLSMAEAFGAVLRNAVTAPRDSVALFLFLLLIFVPGTIRQRLVDAGFTRRYISGCECEAQVKSATETTKSAARTVLQGSENHDELIARIAALEKNATYPALRSEQKEIGTAAESARFEIATADQAIKLSNAAQQQIVAQIEPSIAARSGGVRHRKVSGHKTISAPVSPKTAHPARAGIVAATKLTIRDNFPLRGETSSSARTSAAVLAAAKTGDIVEAVNVDYSHAKGGGRVVWAKVRKT